MINFWKKKKFSKLIKGGVGIKISRVEKFQKINNRGGNDYSEPESNNTDDVIKIVSIIQNISAHFATFLQIVLFTAIAYHALRRNSAGFPPSMNVVGKMLLSKGWYTYIRQEKQTKYCETGKRTKVLRENILKKIKLCWRDKKIGKHWKSKFIFFWNYYFHSQYRF